MVKIKMFGSLRLKTGFKGKEADVKTIPEACELIAKETGWDVKELKGCIFCVNGVMNAKISTKLKDGDELIFMAPSGGG